MVGTCILPIRREMVRWVWGEERLDPRRRGNGDLGFLGLGRVNGRRVLG